MEYNFRWTDDPKLRLLLRQDRKPADTRWLSSYSAADNTGLSPQLDDPRQIVAGERVEIPIDAPPPQPQGASAEFARQVISDNPPKSLMDRLSVGRSDGNTPNLLTPQKTVWGDRLQKIIDEGRDANRISPVEAMGILNQFERKDEQNRRSAPPSSTARRGRNIDVPEEVSTPQPQIAPESLHPGQQAQNKPRSLDDYLNIEGNSEALKQRLADIEAKKQERAVQEGHAALGSALAGALGFLGGGHSAVAQGAPVAILDALKGVQSQNAAQNKEEQDAYNQLLSNYYKSALDKYKSDTDLESAKIIADYASGIRNKEADSKFNRDLQTENVGKWEQRGNEWYRDVITKDKDGREIKRDIQRLSARDYPTAIRGSGSGSAIKTQQELHDDFDALNKEYRTWLGKKEEAKVNGNESDVINNLDDIRGRMENIQLVLNNYYGEKNDTRWHKPKPKPEFGGDKNKKSANGL